MRAGFQAEGGRDPNGRMGGAGAGRCHRQDGIGTEVAVTYQDYYQTLGVARTATQDEIQRAYRKLARKFHPDVSKEKNAEEKFKELGEAYEVLGDPEKRRKYDQLGSNWQAGQDFRPPPGFENVHFEFRGGPGGFRGAGMGGDEPFSDFFSSLFGGGGDDMGPLGGLGGGGRRRGIKIPRPGSSHEVEVEIPILEAVKGSQRSFTFDVTEPGADGVPQRSKKTLNVRIPAGVTEGQKIRLQGQGGAGRNGGPSGDLFLKLRFQKDPRFTAHGHNLHTVLKVSPWEAALGAKVPVETLEGEVRLAVPAGTQSGAKLRLKGKGIPRAGGEPGDLLAEVRIVVPRTLDPEERRLLEELAARSGFDPRKERG